MISNGSIFRCSESVLGAGHRLDHRRSAPVNVDGYAGEVAGALGGEEGYHVAGFVGFRHAAQRHSPGLGGLIVEIFDGEAGIGFLHPLVAPFVLAAFDNPNADCVDQDIVLAQVFG